MTGIGFSLALAAAVLGGALVWAAVGARVAEDKGVTHADPASAEKLIKGDKVVVLDIRTPEEYSSGHIKDAKNIDFSNEDFEKRLGELKRDRRYLVHCASGRRSTRSLAVFKRLGFSSVVHLDGGISAWKKAGKPVTR